MKVSNSELRLFKRCRRRWWFTHYLHLRRRSEGPGPLALGNMVHHVLANYYGCAEGRQQWAESGAWRHALAAYVAERVELLEVNGAGAQVAAMLSDAEYAAIMCEGYFTWLAEDGVDQRIEVLGPERELEAFLGELDGEQVWLVAKLDVEALVRDTGDVLFVDHKTVQNLSDLPKVAALDEQIRTYGLVERLLAASGQEPWASAPRAAGGIFNMLRKVKRSSTAKPPFYGRHQVRHNEEVFRQMYLRVWGEVRDILAVTHALDGGYDHQVVAYPNPTRDCSWDCPFLSVCPMVDDGSDYVAVLAEAYEQHDPYERYVELEKQ